MYRRVASSSPRVGRLSDTGWHHTKTVLMAMGDIILVAALYEEIHTTDGERCT